MADQVFKKDADYGNKNDFVGESEITVTITLAEYRDLVATKATRDDVKAKLQKRIWELERENNDLKAAIDLLRQPSCQEDHEIEDGAE